jgi:hypothetical protein
MVAMAQPKKQPKPNRTGVPYVMRFSTDVYKEMMEYITSQRLPPNKRDVIELAVREFLEREESRKAGNKD